MSKVLVVDDEYHILILLRSILESGGHEVSLLNKPELVLEHIDSFQPDVLLLDVVFPSATGFAITEKIRLKTEYDEMKIVLCSALSRDVDIETGKKVGADAFLFKPFTEENVNILLDHLTSI